MEQEKKSGKEKKNRESKTWKQKGNMKGKQQRDK